MPVIWLIDAYRAGERSQLRALVQALGWPCEIRQLNYRKYNVITHLLPMGSVAGIDRASAESLRPPWPDLVISCGVRNEPVCRWIREASGGHTRYIHVGRIWAPPSLFDLVITTPQYRVPSAANVIRNDLTLHQVTPQRLHEGASQWAPQWLDLPRPFTAVIVGGDSGPFTLGPKAAARLGREASEIARESGGSLLVSTSSRTSKEASLALQNALDAPHYFYPWCPDRDANPYWGMLGAADNFIVTADSIAMLSETCATAKPVSMFDIGGMRKGYEVERDFRLGGTLFEALIRWGWQPLSRDITLVHEKLVAHGRAAWLGETLLPFHSEEGTGMDRALTAVEGLFPQSGITAGFD
jgi:mitochondrial fission protein ELM1